METLLKKFLIQQLTHGLWEQMAKEGLLSLKEMERTQVIRIHGSLAALQVLREKLISHVTLRLLFLKSITNRLQAPMPVIGLKFIQLSIPI